MCSKNLLKSESDLKIIVEKLETSEEKLETSEREKVVLLKNNESLQQLVDSLSKSLKEDEENLISSAIESLSQCSSMTHLNAVSELQDDRDSAVRAVTEALTCSAPRDRILMTDEHADPGLTAGSGSGTNTGLESESKASQYTGYINTDSPN